MYIEIEPNLLPQFFRYKYLSIGIILNKFNCTKTPTFLLSTDNIHDDEEHEDMAHIISIEGKTFTTDKVFFSNNSHHVKV